MKIDYLKVNSRFKNLDQITVNFDENQLTTVVVGWNGAGKSNVIEALVAIFRDLDLGESPRFAYEIKYKLGNSDKAIWVKVDADPTRGKTPSKQYKIQYAVMDPKNWTLPVGVELRARNEVQDVEETQEFRCGVQDKSGAGITEWQEEPSGSQPGI